MKITCTIPGATPSSPPNVRVLGDDASGEYITGFLPAAAVEVQSSTFIRGRSRRVNYRGNVATTFSFQTSRDHLSEAAALAFMADEIQEITGMKGDVAISGLGSLATVRLLEDAVISQVRAVMHVGKHTVMQYIVEGGEFN